MDFSPQGQGRVTRSSFPPPLSAEDVAVGFVKSGASWKPKGLRLVALLTEAPRTPTHVPGWNREAKASASRDAQHWGGGITWESGELLSRH